MLCPVCKVPLTMSERQGIEIDYCPQCRGVWLDRGELDKILERSATASAPQPEARTEYRQQEYRQPEYRDRRYDVDDDHYKHRRRKSWLDELFD